MTVITSLVVVGMILLFKPMMDKLVTKSTKNAQEMDVDESDSVGSKTRDRYFAAWFTAVNTLNIRPLASICTNLYYHTMELTTKLYNKLGLRRECGFASGDNSAGTTAGEVSMIGKVASTSHNMRGSYRETLYDSTTGGVLLQKDYPDGVLGMQIQKNPYRQRDEVRYCSGCGAELATGGELFICRSCGTTYTSDSYDWVLNQINAAEVPHITKLKSMLTLNNFVYYFSLTNLLGIPIMALAALVFDWLVLPVYIVNFISAALIIGFVGYSVSAYSGLMKVEKADPLCNRFRVIDRCSYLLRLFYRCRSVDPAGMRAFMDTAAYDRWRQADGQPPTLHLLELGYTLDPHVTGYRNDGTRQHLTVAAPLKLTVFDEVSRTVQVIRRTVKLGIYRNAATRYQHELTSEVFVCRGCGMSVDMTADGRCRSCGTEYDVADYDWKLEHLDSSAYI